MLLLATPLFTAAILSQHAYAQDEDEGGDEDGDEGGSRRPTSDDEDADEDSAKKKKKKAAGSSESAGRIREIVRGFYGKVDVGSAGYPLNLGDSVKWGTLVGISVGQDFVDNEKQSMAWEVGFVQGVHNGGAASLAESLAQGTTCPDMNICTQGDLRTYSLQVNYEFSLYPIRRVGLGFRIGGGALYSPLTIERDAYDKIISSQYSGSAPTLMDSIHPYGLGGLTAEYYTKLNHFSIGADIDGFYAVGWDLGVVAAGYFKYTF
jgi:hypothetical protein